MEFSNLSISSEDFTSLLELIASNKISGKIAKEVLDKMFDTNEAPEKIVEKYNLSQISNIGEIEKYIDDIISANPEKVEEYRSGKDKLFGFFVGEIMKVSKGKANPQSVNEILIKKLQSN